MKEQTNKYKMNELKKSYINHYLITIKINFFGIQNVKNR